MNREKVIELAREADACHDNVRVTPFLERFAALIEREVRIDCLDSQNLMDKYMGLTVEIDSAEFAKFFEEFGEGLAIKHRAGIVRELAKKVLDLRKEREVRGDAEPVAFEFQHEDTGLIDFVDPQQVEWGFQKNNPRWQLIGPVFRHPSPAVVRQLVEALDVAEDYLVEALSKHDEAYDNYPAMQADRDLIVQDIHQLKAALNSAVRWEMKMDDAKAIGGSDD